MDWIEIIKLGWPIIAAGAAWGGAKQALNGTRERVNRLEKWANERDAFYLQMMERTARIETKIDMLMENK